MASLSYWFDPRPGPIGGLWPLYAALGLVLAAVLVAGGWPLARGRAGHSAIGRGQLALAVLGLALVAARAAGWPLVSMRALAPAVAALALALPWLARGWPRPWSAPLARAREVLAFAASPDDPPPAPAVAAVLLALVAAALVAGGPLAGWPPALAPALALALLGAPLAVPARDTPARDTPARDTPARDKPARDKPARDTPARDLPAPRRLRPELLVPLLWPAAVLAVRIAVAVAARLGGAEAFAPPAPWDQILDTGAALRAGFAYSALVTGLYLLRAWGRGALASLAAALALGVGLAGWALPAYLTRQTSGVTGADPFAYTLMGVDIAQTGLPLHRFPLAALAGELGLPLEPVVHLGYRPPIDAAGRAPTVWPPGHSALLALGYRLLGERGLYLVTPFVALLAAVATGLLAWTLYPGALRPDLRPLAAVLAAGLLATSPEQIVRALVPMADASAQLFSVLALWLAWRATAAPAAAAGRVARLAILAGACYGLAYDMRYTQVLLAPSFAALGLRLPDRRRRSAFYAPLGLAALALALPDLWYHVIAFGGALRVGSDELRYFAASNLWPMVRAVWAEASAPGEFAWPWLWLLALVGLAGLWRAHRRWLFALLSGPALVVAFQLPYGYLRLRDLLPQFPLFDLAVAVGAVAALDWAARRRAVSAPAGGPVLAATLALLALALAARSEPTLGMPFSPGFGTFGYLQPPQRAAFDRLAALAESNAVVAATLNSGPVELYAGRQSFRPDGWAPGAALAFVNALREQGRPVYVLADGALLEPVLATLRARYGLREVARLPLPYFFPGGGSLNQDVALYRVESPGAAAAGRR